MSRRFHLFKHPWSLEIKIRSSENESSAHLGVGDTLDLKDPGGLTYLRIKWEGETLYVTQLYPVLTATPATLRGWADFADKERTA